MATRRIAGTIAQSTGARHRGLHGAGGQPDRKRPHGSGRYSGGQPGAGTRLLVRQRRRVNMPLILHGLTPIHWALAGAGIAAVTLTLLFVANRRLGISPSFEDLCSFVLPSPYFQRAAVLSGRVWRMPFPPGWSSVAFCPRFSAAAGRPTWALGMFDAVIGFGQAGKLAWMFAGGLFIGFGTRLAGGCTSGHGIFGMSNFEWPSLLSTLVVHGRRHRHHPARLPRGVRLRRCDDAALRRPRNDLRLRAESIGRGRLRLHPVDVPVRVDFSSTASSAPRSC